ncbi:methyltransferase domain-containing protein [Roseateles sp.]|uniref:methyltransferase domain-containing protein n=1 Tax=Roseateles sp. TaxID=1971397 RepID=UPI002F412D2D
MTVPYSDGQGKNAALDWYRQIAPATVVDIGAGSGTYAKLMRPPGRTWPHDSAFWIAYEAWEPYVGEYGLEDLYDDVRVGDARVYAHYTAFSADLVIAGDVLEHMPRADAQRLIADFKRAAANLIVSIPVLHLDQGAVYGNPYETHVDHWTADAMRAELGDGVVAEWVGDVLAYFWWRKE